MKLAAFLLLVAGWIIMISAVVLFVATAGRAAFVGAGVAVQVLGLGLAVRAHLVQGEEHE